MRPPVYYSGQSFPLEVTDDGVTRERPDGGQEVRGLVGTCRNETSDPRVDGLGTFVHDQDVYGGLPLSPRWGTFRLENEGGAWEGPYMGVRHRTEAWPPVIIYIGRYVGEGGYEGLSRLDVVTYPAQPGVTGVIEGVILDGDLPQMG
jgi:hypothetical protein